MVSVKPLNELTIAPDGCFALVGASQTVTILYDTPLGTVEYTNFEAFSHPAGTILRFPDTNQHNNVTPWSMRVVLDDSEQNIQWRTYEDDYDMWENIDRSPHIFYGFLKSVDVQGFDQTKTFLDLNSRCDYGAYGPMAYHSATDGVSKTVLDPKYMLKISAGDTYPVLSANGLCHITFFYVHGMNMSWRNWPAVTLVAKTLSGLVRQLASWRDLYLAGISSDDFARDANSFFELCGITDSMIEELRETEVLMPTERFFLGYGNPRHGFTETGILPDSIKDQLTKNIRYRTLSVLEKKHPLKPAISSETKEQEKQLQIERVLKWFYTFKPWVPKDEISTELLLSDLYNNDPTKQLTAPTLATGTIHLNGVRSARFFDATE